MSNLKSTIRMLEHIYFILTPKQKRDSIVVFVSMIVCSILELLGVSIVYPFLQLMLDEASIKGKWYLSWLFIINPTISSSKIIVMMGLAIAIVYVVKNAIAIYCTYLQTHYSAKLNRELSTRILDSYMRQPYEFFVNTNSSILIRGLNGDVSAVYNIISNCFQIFAQMFSILLIVIYLIKVDSFVAILSITIAGVCFLAVTFGFKGIMKKTGKQFRVVQAKQSACCYQNIMGIKEITVLDRREAYVGKYEKLAKEMERCSTINGSVSAAPDRILEGICISGIMAVLCIRIAHGVDVNAFIPTLGAFVMGVFRIMPSISKVSSRINSIVFFMPGLDNTYDTLISTKVLEKEREINSELDVDRGNADEIQFHDRLVVDNITWRYSGNQTDIINGLSLVVKKGESIAFIGSSGGGKSTLADILMTLFKPQKGSVTMDGMDIFSLKEKWLNLIGFVPQSVFLIDDTVRANIAFGLPDEKISEKKIWKALERAQIKDFVESLPQGLDTMVGENGVKFSGGQRQRIAIARALYDDPEILIMDEATAALDVETEKAFMESIDALHGEKTIILVAHRLSTVKNCDRIYEIGNGIAIEKSKDEVLRKDI